MIDRWGYALIYSHVWVAGAAIALCMQTLALADASRPGLPLILFVFAGTMTAYSLQRWVGIRVLSPQRLAQIHPLQRYWPWMILFGGLAAFYAFLGLSSSGRIVGMVAGLLSVAYILPISRHQRIRDIPGLKIFLISIVWATTTVLLPLADASQSLEWPTTAWHFLSRALFIFAITLPFDLRDLQSDSQHQTLTLPLLLGWPVCVRLGLLALTLSMMIDLGLGGTAQTAWLPLVGNAVTWMCSGLLLVWTHKDRPEHYFGLLIDGVMYLPWLVTLLLYWICQ